MLFASAHSIRFRLERRLHCAVIFLVMRVSLFSDVVSAHLWLIACDENFPPYNYIDENGEARGLNYE